MKTLSYLKKKYVLNIVTSKILKGQKKLGKK